LLQARIIVCRRRVLDVSEQRQRAVDVMRSERFEAVQMPSIAGVCEREVIEVDRPAVGVRSTEPNAYHVRVPRQRDEGRMHHPEVPRRLELRGVGHPCATASHRSTARRPVVDEREILADGVRERLLVPPIRVPCTPDRRRGSDEPVKTFTL
jgi:hypothetical protein